MMDIAELKAQRDAAVAAYYAAAVGAAKNAGKKELGDKVYMADALGTLTPIEAMNTADLLQDEQVRKIFFFAEDLSAQVARFREHTIADLDGFDELLRQEYKVAKGGRKGNRSYLSHDGLLKILVQVQDNIDFGPQLQVAKDLVDECLAEWSEGANSNLRAVIARAFNTDKAGKINRGAVLSLLRLELSDPRWQDAMRAIKDAMRVVYSKQYVRFYKRKNLDSQWEAITIDIAKS